MLWGLNFKFKLFSFIQTKSFDTCVVTQNSCIQVCPTKFTFVNIKSRENFEEFPRFSPWGLNPFKIHRKSKFESSMNFKRVQALWEKFVKFTKTLSQHDLHKSEFSWAHLYAKIGVLIEVSKWIDSGIWNEFELKFKPHGTYNTNQANPIFHSSFYST